MDAYRSALADVLASSMHYLQAGAGRPVLLLHGNPTSGFLWRHLLNRAGRSNTQRRWIAPDLIGMGQSGKPDLGYRLADHIAYVDGFIDALELTDLVVVGHDWGVAIALDLLRRRPELVRGFGFMEAHLRPLESWASFDGGGRTLFEQLRTPGVGEELVLEQNFFLDTLLPAALTHPLTNADLASYREPYPDVESRRPLLQWPREIPIAGEPPDVAARLRAGADSLVASDIPKLLVYAEPGVLVGAETVAWCRQNLTRLTLADVGGPAGHFLPEDRPVQVADAILNWVDEL